MGNLLIIQGGSEYVQVRRRGRFAVPREYLDSPAHLKAAIADAQDKMIYGLAKVGYEYQDSGFDLSGPFLHIEFSDDVSPDPGVHNRPDPNDTDAWERWERAEKARTAKRADLQAELVDFELTGTFLLKTRQAPRALLPTKR